MDLGALQEKANVEIQKFETHVGHKDFDEMLFLYMSKITEEIGNLAAAVLGKEGIRADQPVTDELLNLTFGEALNSIIVLAEKMHINLDRVMQEKMQRLEEGME